ncbi:MAG TPA: hypothetical protein VLX59_14920 [Acidimicrobiales bacterium]|nr:hypothetical protein [Acidimicrobiales bacterium]
MRSSSWSRIPTAASSSVLPRWAHAVGRCSGLLTLAVQAQVLTHTLRHMIYAYPTFHRDIEGAIKDLSA